MKITITINTENEAFDRNLPAELARILQTVVAQLQHSVERYGCVGDDTNNAIMDTNGNRVGSWSLTETDR